MNTLDNIDDILGDVLEKIEESDAKPDIVIEDNKPKANIDKFNGLLEAFDIGSDGLAENIQAHKDDIMNDLSTVNTSSIKLPEEVTTSLVNTENMIEDHEFVRQVLKEDISATRIVVAKLAEEISTQDMDELNGQVTEAYASIKKANMQSMKLLLDSYTTVAETQVKIKKIANEIKALDQGLDKGSVTNNTVNFIGTPAELLASIKGD